MAAHIAYYRVSTDRQGASGLGLEAQRAAVLRHSPTWFGEGKELKEHTFTEQQLEQVSPVSGQVKCS